MSTKSMPAMARHASFKAKGKKLMTKATKEQQAALKELVELRDGFNNAIGELINVSNRYEDSDLMVNPFMTYYGADELECLIEWLQSIADTSRQLRDRRDR
jgi:hypothetical protein